MIPALARHFCVTMVLSSRLPGYPVIRTASANCVVRLAALVDRGLPTCSSDCYPACSLGAARCRNAYPTDSEVGSLVIPADQRRGPVPPCATLCPLLVITSIYFTSELSPRWRCCR